MEQLYGEEFLGAAKYESFAVSNLPLGRCGKTFSKEFGPSQTIHRRWAEQGTHPVIATQGLWRGGIHDYSGQKILTEGLKELEKFAAIAYDFPFQSFQFSIFCEHKITTSPLRDVFTQQWEIVKYLPNIVLVNTPMTGGDLLRPGAFEIPEDRLLNEFHGNWNPTTTGFAPYMWGCDGMPAQDCDIQRFKNLHSKALIIWLWMQQYNCKKKVDETTPISQRKVKPVLKQVISLEYLIPKRGSTSFNVKSIFKTHGDQHGNTPTGREQKPVIITPVDAEKLEFRTLANKLISNAPRSGNYTDGRPMYRLPIWGFELQDLAMATSTKPLVKVVAVKKGKKTSLGRVNPAFRENAYKNKAHKTVSKRLKAIKNDEELFDDTIKINPDWV